MIVNLKVDTPKAKAVFATRTFFIANIFIGKTISRVWR